MGTFVVFGVFPLSLQYLTGCLLVKAFIAATSLHLFLNTSLSDGVIDATKKGKVCVASFFIAYNLYDTLYASKKAVAPKEKKS